jgi:hypothetical protein
MRWPTTGMGLIAALMLSSSAQAAEVFDLRVGYWEIVWTYPDKSLHKEFTCLTPEELEGMRFFISTQKDCTLSPGSQTRTRYEANAVCGQDAERMKIRWVLEARDRMTFTAAASYVIKGKPISAKATGRWLQESCSAPGIPIS